MISLHSGAVKAQLGVAGASPAALGLRAGREVVRGEVGWRGLQ